MGHYFFHSWCCGFKGTAHPKVEFRLFTTHPALDGGSGDIFLSPYLDQDQQVGSIDCREEGRQKICVFIGHHPGVLRKYCQNK